MICLLWLRHAAAWEGYTLYYGLWFTGIVYNDDFLEQHIKNGDYTAANQLLKQMLADMSHANDGRFQSVKKNL